MASSMDAVTLATLACVVLIGLERVLSRFSCPGFHGFSHVDLAVSRCCHIEVERQQSPPSSPTHASGVPPPQEISPASIELERSVADVIESIASRRGSILSPAASVDLAQLTKP